MIIIDNNQKRNMKTTGKKVCKSAPESGHTPSRGYQVTAYNSTVLWSLSFFELSIEERLSRLTSLSHSFAVFKSPNTMLL